MLKFMYKLKTVLSCSQEDAKRSAFVRLTRSENVHLVLQQNSFEQFQSVVV